MISILFFLPDLGGGGAQRTVVNIVNHLERGRFAPVLAVGSGEGPYRSLVKTDVKVLDLGRTRVRDAIVPLAVKLRKLRPDICFGAYPDSNVALMLARALARVGGSVVLRESNHRSAQEVNWGLLMEKLLSWSYRRADRVVALSEGVRCDMIRRYHLRPENVLRIYNPVDLDRIRCLAQHELDRDPPENEGGGNGRFRIVACGRLVRQKGFDLLLRAVTGIGAPGVHVTILGEGEERTKLQALARELGIEDRVLMPGFQDNPYRWFRDADLFVLSSRWEGFGHVVVEAMACGVPVLATRCPSGPDEIIADGRDGVLCEPNSVEDLREKIRYLMKHPLERKSLAEAASHSMERFEARYIVSRYEELLGEVAEKNCPQSRC